MKKTFVYLLLMFFTGTPSCFAFSELYYLKNTTSAEIEPIVTASIAEQGYNIIKQNPYYAKSSSGNEPLVIILQQSGNNTFYYYQTNKNRKINKSILKSIKKLNIVYERSFNTGIIGVYDNIAQEIIANAGMQKQYTFEDEAPIFIPPQSPHTSQKTNSLSGYIMQVNAGTRFNVYLQTAINTSSAKKGDKISAMISDNIMCNGVEIIPQGSIVYGELSTAQNATYGSKNGKVVIDFNTIVTPDNDVYQISTEQVEFSVSNEGKVSSIGRNALKSAVIGMFVGSLVAAIADTNSAKTAAIGAGIGGATSVLFSVTEKGVDAEIPTYTEVEIVLTQPFNISIQK